MSRLQRCTNKDQRRLIKAIQNAGGEVTMSRSGHWKVYSPDGHLLTTMSNTSGCYSVKTAARQLKSLGLRIEYP